MKTIAKNEYYELEYNETENLILWTMMGFWKDMSIVPDFDKDWDKILKMVKPDFILLGDLSTLRVLPDDVKTAQDEKQQVIMQKGCKKVAIIVDSATTKLSLNRVLKSSGMEKIIKYCENKTEAMDFLK